jgi:hypothetical protein
MKEQATSVPLSTVDVQYFLNAKYVLSCGANWSEISTYVFLIFWFILDGLCFQCKTFCACNNGVSNAVRRAVFL